MYESWRWRATPMPLFRLVSKTETMELVGAALGSHDDGSGAGEFGRRVVVLNPELLHRIQPGLAAVTVFQE